ncbi:hypothetical protein QZH41_009780, partial [Actinostola sp. cb2023]
LRENGSENGREISWRQTKAKQEERTEVCLNTTKPSKERPNRRSRRKRERAPSTKVHKNMRCPGPSAAYNELCEISDHIMMEVQVFRDNGRWEMFDDIVQRLSREYTSLEAQIVILLEKSMAACYRNNLEESMEMILKAIDDAKDSENSSTLIARAHYYRSGVFRRMRNQTGKADECIHIAEQYLDNTALTLDTTFAAYERGSVLMDFLAKFPNPKSKLKLKNVKEEAKANLKKCIDGSVILEQDTNTQRYIKKHHFAFIKIAMLVLDCRTVTGRKQEVSVSEIKEARDCLDTLRNRYWDGIAQGERIQYYLAMADLNWRQNDMTKAEEFASEAYNMAAEFGFKTEIKPAKERLDEIRVKIQEMSTACSAEYSRGGEGGATESSSSDSQFGDDTSSCESDFLCSQSL